MSEDWDNFAFLEENDLFCWSCGKEVAEEVYSLGDLIKILKKKDGRLMVKELLGTDEK